MRNRNIYALIAGVIAMTTLIFVSFGWTDEITDSSKVTSSTSVQKTNQFVDANNPDEDHKWTEEEALQFYYEMLAAGLPTYPFTWEQITYINANKIEIPVEYLTAEIITVIVVSKKSSEYWCDESGLHWGHRYSTRAASWRRAPAPTGCQKDSNSHMYVSFEFSSPNQCSPVRVVTDNGYLSFLLFVAYRGDYHIVAKYIGDTELISVSIGDTLLLFAGRGNRERGFNVVCSDLRLEYLY